MCGEVDYPEADRNWLLGVIEFAAGLIAAYYLAKYISMAIAFVVDG